MSKDPVISFIVPVYRKPPETFEKCLEHLFDQSVKEVEVICIFDGADAELEAVAKRYPVKSVVIEHGGAPRARNEGFKYATGRYISHWDCDCFIKPEAAQMWLDTFERNKDAAFVYSGYQFENEMGAYESEPFDPYSLQCGNFIASMFPLKREWYPEGGWDESLTAAQDWDFWLSVVEKGGKGIFIQGYAFETEYSQKGSISSEGWGEKRAETIARVRAKHAIPDRQIAVYGTQHFAKALHLAKLLNADLLKGSGPALSTYKMVINLGYNQMVRFGGTTPETVKVQYWMPWDIDCLHEIRHKTAVDSIELAKKEVTHHWVNEVLSKKRMESVYIGIHPEIVPLPTEIDDLEKELPAEFRVLVDCDKAYEPLFKTLADDLPYIKIDSLQYVADIKLYSMLLSFHPHPTIDEGMRRFLLNGRNLISNVQQPYCGYIDMEVSHPEFKKELFKRIRLGRELPFNTAGQEYYSNLVDPSKFKEKVYSLLEKPILEVVS